jgi:MYXO-CTERM domain-containing protein
MHHTLTLYKKIALTALTALVGLLAPRAATTAHAFCGFYVSGAGGEMFNNATQVVLMREGTRTVLSMQNNYQGPPESFAMVVPVPVVLQEENVKTLDKKVFHRVDTLAAPRLVEYWEQDPCQVIKYEEKRLMRFAAAADEGAGPPESSADLGVTVEAQFAVAEYEIVILSAKDSTGLDTWLKQEHYQIPSGAEPLLRPYVESGSKFFVAKVNADKVTFKDGMAALSPLRFHYDSDELSLPVRLGLINSAGTQDLIVHILARGQRDEVANYKNVTIPTNLDVADEVRRRFGEFYAALFDATLEKNPGAVVTEYSWDASTCDPCPSPALSPGELATLGADVLHGAPGGFVLTRLHARYGKDSLADDLVFTEAAPIAGGREAHKPDGSLEQGAQPGPRNNFQGRYAIRHEWTGPITCDNPKRGVWGGPPAGTSGSTGPQPALDLAFAPRGNAELPRLVKQNIPEIGVSMAGLGANPAAPPAPAPTGSDQAAGPTTTPKAGKRGCGCTLGPHDAPGAGALALLTMLGVAVVRRRRSQNS